MSMKDPIGIYENLKEQYFKYIDTAFSVVLSYSVGLIIPLYKANFNKVANFV